MSLGIGVIGAGIMGADHAQNLHRFVRGAEVSRVADLDHDRATAVTDQIAGAKPTTDPVALVHDDAVDAVLIASADATHAALVQECLATRKPVLCEKPLAPTAEECRSLVEAEREAVLEALRAHDGSRERAAEALDISPTTLWRKMTRLGVTFDGRQS